MTWGDLGPGLPNGRLGASGSLVRNWTLLLEDACARDYLN
jgi:hypothetical protein